MKATQQALEVAQLEVDGILRRRYSKLNLYRGIGSDKIVRGIPAN